MIPETNRDSVLMAAAQFVHEITAAYGGDEGVKIWERISEVLDPDIRNELFMIMLTGDGAGDSVINIRQQSVSATDTVARNRVEFIKYVRTHDTRMLGLKEAKDISDEVTNGIPTKFVVPLSQRSDIANYLRNHWSLDVR